MTTGGVTRTFVVQCTTTADGCFLTLDCDADGDLAEEVSLKLALVDGAYAARFEHGLACGPLKLVFPMKEGKLGSRVYQYLESERSGTIVLGNRRIVVTLVGWQGHFNEEHDAVFIDLNEDGVLQTATRQSDERYEIVERHVNIGNHTYAFDVAPDGSTLELNLSPQALPARSLLDSGNPAPDVSFQNLSGALQKLSDYRGRIVLLYAWATWCASCKADYPNMVELRKQFDRGKLEIIGINKGETREVVSEYTKSQAFTWVQALDSDEKIFQTFRLGGIPSFVLIDSKGLIVARGLGGAAGLTTKITELLKSQECLHPGCEPVRESESGTR